MCTENHVCFGRIHGCTYIRTYVPWYHGIVPYHGVRTGVPFVLVVQVVFEIMFYLYVHVYLGIAIPWYVVLEIMLYVHVRATMVPRYRTTMVVYHGTSEYRGVLVMSFMLTTPTSFPVAPECLYFKMFLI
jgi:hypothetical protein